MEAYEAESHIYSQGRVIPEHLEIHLGPFVKRLTVQPDR